MAKKVGFVSLILSYHRQVETKQKVLADFFIGAYVGVAGYSVLTRVARRYAT
ncbi:MAG: hypothetical protein JJ714_06155 [Acidithiobacillus sp.]|nr:hypothetical protein [Acidithiobacillus sp.]